MAEIPPSPNQPPQFVAYPRAALNSSADKLQALGEGYFGLNMVFVLNVALTIGSRALSVIATPENALMFVGLQAAVVGVLIGALTYPQNKKIGYGLNWSPAGAVIASILMGINSALCCGIIGYVVMQQIASSEMKKYGVKGGFFGVRKNDVAVVVGELRANQALPNFPPPAVP